MFDEHLEGLVDCSVVIRCLDLLGICLAMTHLVNGPYSSRRKVKKFCLKFKCNSSPCRG